MSNEEKNAPQNDPAEALDRKARRAAEKAELSLLQILHSAAEDGLWDPVPGWIGRLSALDRGRGKSTRLTAFSSRPIKPTDGFARQQGEPPPEDPPSGFTQIGPELANLVGVLGRVEEAVLRSLEAAARGGHWDSIRTVLPALWHLDQARFHLATHTPEEEESEEE